MARRILFHTIARFGQDIVILFLSELYTLMGMNACMEKQHINSSRKGSSMCYRLMRRTIFVETIYKETLEAKAAAIEGSSIDQKFGKE